MMKMSDRMRAAEQPTKRPGRLYINKLIQMNETKNYINQLLNGTELEISPRVNEILCLSFLVFGLKVLMPCLRFELEKCLMNVSSTLSMSLVNFNET